jgi:transcriptional regulator with XRE-family HTH domain
MAGPLYGKRMMAPKRPRGAVRPSAIEVGKRTSHIRSRLGMSKVGFARQLGVSRNTLIHYERGGGLPRSAILTRIAQAGGVSVDWLLTGHATDEIQRSTDWEHAFQRLRLAWRDHTRHPLVLGILTALAQDGGQRGARHRRRPGK